MVRSRRTDARIQNVFIRSISRHIFADKSIVHETVAQKDGRIACCRSASCCIRRNFRGKIGYGIPRIRLKTCQRDIVNRYTESSREVFTLRTHVYRRILTFKRSYDIVLDINFIRIISIGELLRLIGNCENGRDLRKSAVAVGVNVNRLIFDTQISVAIRFICLRLTGAVALFTLILAARRKHADRQRKNERQRQYLPFCLHNISSLEE